MFKNQKVVVIIPARGGSKRLPGKNIYPVWGKPMLYWAIRACKNSQYVDQCFVSTESEKITRLAQDFGAEIIVRPAELADDMTFKQDVIVHAVTTLDEKPDIVISLQPNSPEICCLDLDAAIEKFVKYDRNEIFTVGENLIQNAAFRVMKFEYVFQKSISTRCGVFVTSYRDVHSIEDVQDLEDHSQPCQHDKRRLRNE